MIFVSTMYRPLFCITGFFLGLFLCTSIAEISLDLHKNILLYDQNNQVFYQEFVDDSGYHNFVLLSEIPKYLQEAFVKLEDKRFYLHFGLDPLAIIRSSFLNLKYGKVVSGGSGITQQLVRNIVKPQKRGLAYKIQEAVIAMKLDWKYSKEEILESYLNSIYFGNQAYGIAAASQTFFNKVPQELTVNESIFLAGLPQSPSVYNPFLQFEKAEKRKEVVVKILEKNGYFEGVCERAVIPAQAGIPYQTDKHEIPACAGMTKWSPIHLYPNTVNLVAPHYQNLVYQEFKNITGNSVFSEKADIKIYTYLDFALFQSLEEMTQNHMKKLSDKNISNAAFVVLDHKKQAVVALLGSVDFFNEEIDGQVNNAVSLRQPGSTIKPFTYALAFENGDSPNSLIDDSFLHLQTEEGNAYEPKNYDFKEYGKVSYAQALANSYNISAIKIAQKVGVENLLQTLRKLGLHTLTETADNYGVALTLGDGELKLLDLTAAYSVFPNNGLKKDFSFIRKIEINGEIIYEHKNQKAERIFSQESAENINAILSSNEARSQQFGVNSSLKTSVWSAAKTGTTRNFRDNWTLGYTRDFSVGVWVGNADASYLKNSTGITGAAPIWHDIIEALPQKTSEFQFSEDLLVNNVKEVQADFSAKDVQQNETFAEEKQDVVISPQNGDIFLLEGSDQEAIIFKSKIEVFWYLDNKFFGQGKKLFLENPKTGSYCVEVFKDKEKREKVTKNCFSIL